MGKRGAISAAELATMQPRIGKRVEPPDTMPDAQKKFWNVIVNSLPVDWFSEENEALLVQYVRTKARADYIAKRIDSGKLNSKEMADAIKQEGALTRDMAMLATKMRLAQQSTYDKSKVKRRGPTLVVDDRPDAEEETDGADTRRESLSLD